MHNTFFIPKPNFHKTLLLVTLILSCLFSAFLFAKETHQPVNLKYQEAVQAENEHRYHSALELYQLATKTAQSQNNLLNQIESLYGQIRIYQKLNRGADAFRTIKQLEALSTLVSDSATLIRNYRTLAIAYQSVGRNEIARDYYAVAVETSREQEDELLLASLLNEQAYADTLVPDMQNALITFDESKSLYKKHNKKTQYIDTSLNLIQAQILSANKQQTLSSLKELERFISEIGASTLSPPSPSQLLRQGVLYRAAHIKFNLSGKYRKKSYDNYVKAKNKAEKNSANFAYAVGYLGQLYSDEGKYIDAISFTQQALEVAQAHNLLQMKFKWQLQLSRAYKANKQTILAESSYSRVIDTLDKIDKKTFNTLGKSFEQDVEPVFEEYINIILTNALNLKDGEAKTKAFEKALIVHHKYNVYEVNSYCRSSCSIPVSNRPLQVVEGKVLLASFLLNERLLTLSVTGKNIQYSLSDKKSTEKHKEIVDNFYRWAVKPFIKDIITSNTKEIIFLNNNLIGEVPYHTMKVNGRYLIEDYVISLATNIYDTDQSFIKNTHAKIGKYSRIVNSLSINDAIRLNKNDIQVVSQDSYKRKYSGVLDIDIPVSINPYYKDSTVNFYGETTSFSSFLYDQEKVKLDLLIQRNVNSDSFRQTLKANSLINTPFFLCIENSGDLIKTDEFVNNFISYLKAGKNIPLAYQESVKSFIKMNKGEKTPLWSRFRLINQSYYSN
ncbi:MAG: hypothetical protein OEM38_09100 [Gammaproteobacteria bacterium]|nr:hypothetical protein [Gammaproteobacteria bacterium]